MTTTLTVAQVRGWDPARLETAARDLGVVAADLDHEVRAVESAMDTAARSWSGPAADAAASRVSREVTRGRELGQALESARRVLASGATQLTSTRSQLLSVVGDTRSQGFSVADDGSVTVPRTSPALSAPRETVAELSGAEPEELEGRARQQADAVAQAMQAVADADRRTATSLAEVDIPSSMRAEVEASLERLRTSGDLMTALGPVAGAVALGYSLKKAWKVFGKSRAYGSFLGSTFGALRHYPRALRFFVGPGPARSADLAAYLRFQRHATAMRAAQTEFHIGGGGLLARIPGLGGVSRAMGKAFLPVTVVTGLGDAVTGGGYDGARGWATRGFGLAGAVGAGGMLAMSAGVLASNPVGWAVAGGAVLAYTAWSVGNYVYDHWGEISDFAGRAAGWVGDRAGVAGQAVSSATDGAVRRLDDAANAAGEAADRVVDAAGDLGKGALRVASPGVL